MSKIYIASKGAVVEFGPAQHLYLVKDNDGIISGIANATDDELIIRGGPENATPPNGKIILEAPFLIGNSDDDIGDLTVIDRNYTEIDLGGRDADTVWQQMVNNAQNMGVLNSNGNHVTAINYGITINSNSTIHSVLSSVGINLFTNMPIEDGLRKNIIDYPGIEAVFGLLTDGEIDARVLSRNDIDSDVYDQGGNTTIKIGTNNEYEVRLDNDFSTREHLQIQGIDPALLKPVRSGFDLLLVDSLHPSDTIVTIKDFFKDATHKIDSMEGLDSQGASTGKTIKLSHDTLNYYNWNIIMYAFANGMGEAGLTSLQVLKDDGTTTTKIFSGTGVNGYPANITKDDLTLLAQTHFATGDRLQYAYQQSGGVTAQQDAAYKAQIVEESDKLKQLFAPYAALDSTSVTAYADALSFAEQIISWTNSKLLNFGTDAADLAQIGQTQQNIFSVYNDLATGLQDYVSANADAIVTSGGVTTLSQRLISLITDVAPIYTQVLLDEAPYLASLTPAYQSMMGHLASCYVLLGASNLNLIYTASGMATSYLETTSLGSQQSAITSGTAFVYQSAQSVGVPNLTLLRQQHMGNLTLLGAASQLKVQDFNLYSGLTAAQKQSQLIPLESSIVSGLVVPAQDVGYSATDLSTKLLKEVSVTDVAKGTAQLAENISGFNAMMINDVAPSDWTAGTSAVDNFNGTSANEIAFGYGGNDTLRGNDGNDALFGGAGSDTIYGGAGDDRLSGGDGVDTVYGGSGNDTFVLNGILSLGDLLDGEAGVNTLVAQAHADLSLATLRNITNLEIEGSDVSLMAAQFNLFVQYMAYGGSATLQAKTAGTYNLSGKTTSGRISLKGSAGSDVLVGDTKAQTLDGSAGVDQLTGGGGADIFKFSALTDSQYPGAMDLITDFTIGTDKIDVTGLGFTGLTAGTAGTGQLKLRYDSYYNFTYVYDTGTGFGFYMAGNKSALTAADFIGLPPSATVTISGTAGNDVLTGSDANDMLLGYAGADQLIGNSGNDVLDGGAGVDQLTGGAGLDVFRFTMLADSIFASGMDRIADFVKGEDKIDLTGLGFTGVTTGTPTAGQLKLSFDAYYNQTYLRDLNGSGFGFYMTGNQTTITNSDMIGLV